ncbi:MAG TPA: hypothetical protein VE954_14390 [Oligoflexus sp.]|uniref:hypothetical protein n=1 Tax=Oligoflexus sp. TaxID=1971216 RepID=UPI002D6449E9|nr:hypothetical protein [Oligoflexus sp.]HYX34288.1 hypothetical protein [Oligoflexus sp.]
MRFSKASKVLMLLTVSSILIACGIIIGNPGNPAEGGGDASGFVQTIDYDIPPDVSGYELTQEMKDGIFDDSARRIDETIDRVNQMITRLNADAVASVGDFTGKGADGKVSGRIVALTNDANGYVYQAVICYAGQPFQTVEWSPETGSVHTIRNHAIDPVDSRRSAQMLSEITYTKGTSSSIDVWLTVTTKPGQAVPGADGNKLADHTTGTYADGVFTLAGVHNWYNDAATIQEEGDEYFLGQFNDAGVGENVTYNVFRPDCNTVPFDDTAAEHTWCGGRAIPGGSAYTADERVAAATRLKDIPLPGKASLKIPALPTDLSCP